MNNATTVQIESLTVAEKLILMERLWEDLSKQPSNVVPPEWHADVLAIRLTAVEENRTEFADWDAAKDRLRNRLKREFGFFQRPNEILRSASTFMNHNSKGLAHILRTALSLTSNLCVYMPASMKHTVASCVLF